MKFRELCIFDKRFWLDILFPNRCAFCNRIIKWDEYACQTCADKLPYLDEDYCPACKRKVCVCREIGNHFDGCYSVVKYNHSLQSAVVRFKNECPDNFAAFFATKLAVKISADNLAVDFITAVPAAKKSVRHKGYNHAAVLAKYLAIELKLPFIDNVLIKKNIRTKQHELSAEDRAKFVKGLFSMSPGSDVGGKTILLCDDIITTGNTLNACAEILKKNGAARVICATAASTEFMKK